MKKVDAHVITPEEYEEIPEWTDAELADVVLTKRGRPALGSAAKVPIKLRLDPDVVAAYKAGGDGWQTQINDDLRRVKKLKAVKR